MSIDLAQLLKLDPIEKLKIIVALEYSLVPNGPIKLTAEQIEELRRRKREHELHPELAVDWETVKRSLGVDDD